MGARSNSRFQGEILVDKYLRAAAVKVTMLTSDTWRDVQAQDVSVSLQGSRGRLATIWLLPTGLLPLGMQAPVMTGGPGMGEPVVPG